MIQQHGAWYSALILGVQVKVIMLIEQAEKKEDSSSKRYEISKWSFGDDILMTDSIEILCLYCHIVKVLYSIEILDDPQKNDELNTFSNFFNQATNL